MTIDRQQKRLGPKSSLDSGSYVKVTKSANPPNNMSVIVLRTDISNFSRFLDRDYRQATELLGNLSTLIRESVLENDGMFENCIGDRTVSVFTSNFAPEIESNECAALRATKASLKMARLFGKLSRLIEGYDSTLRLRIGLSGGYVGLLGLVPSVKFEDQDSNFVWGELVSIGIGTGNPALNSGIRNHHQKSSLLCDLARKETLQNELRIKEREKDRCDISSPPRLANEMAKLVEQNEMALDKMRVLEKKFRTTIMTDLCEDPNWRQKLERIMPSESFDIIDIRGGLTISTVAKSSSHAYKEEASIMLPQ